MKKLLLTATLMTGFMACTLPAAATTDTTDKEAEAKAKAEARAAERAEAKRRTAAVRWVKKEMSDARRAANLLKKVKNPSSARSAESSLKRLLKPYEEFYGTSVAAAAPANLRLPAGVQPPDLSRLMAAKAAKTPANKKAPAVDREAIREEQKKQAAQRKKLADLVRKNHKLVDQAVRNNYETCGGHAPTNAMETGYIDSAAHFVIQYMCSQP